MKSASIAILVIVLVASVGFSAKQTLPTAQARKASGNHRAHLCKSQEAFVSFRVATASV